MVVSMKPGMTMRPGVESLGGRPLEILSTARIFLPMDQHVRA